LVTIGKLVKEKLFPIKKNNWLLSQESVFLSLSKGKHFPMALTHTRLYKLGEERINLLGSIEVF